MSGGLTIAVGFEGIDSLVGAMAHVRVRLIPTAIKTIQRGLFQHVIPGARDRVARDSGIGRAIWGKDQSGLTTQKLIWSGKRKEGVRAGETSLALHGIPAMLERGGQIKPHKLRRPFGRPQPKNSWLHPGMALRPHGGAQAALDAGEGKIRADVSAAIGEMLGRHGF